MGTLALLLLLGQDSLPFQAAQTQVCDPTTPNQCAPVSSSSGLKVDLSGGTWSVSVDSGTVDLVDRAGRLVGHVSVDSLPAITGSVSVSNFPATQPVSGTVNDVIDGGSLSINNFPPVQPVSGSIAVSNLPRTLSGAVRTDSSGTLQPVADAQVISLLAAELALIANGGQVVQVANFPGVAPIRPLNPFLPRCNAVRQTQCQP